MSVLHRLLSPWLVMLTTWVAAIGVYLYVSAVPGQYPYLEYMLSSEQSIDHSTPWSYAFLAIQFGLFCSGCAAALLFRPAMAPALRADFADLLRHSIAQRLVTATLVTGLVATAWLLGALLEAGGPANLMALAANDNQAARQSLHSASFPGGRLISYGFIGIAVLAAALLGVTSLTAERRRLWIVILTALTFLGLMPVLVSGRITFVTASIAAVVAHALSSRRLPSIRLLVAGLAALCAVWALKEVFVMGHVSAASDLATHDQAIEGALFYVYNDVLNALNAPVMAEDSRTLGWFSTRFIFFMTFTDRPFLAAIAESKASVAGWLTAGEIPLLSAPYVDFGWIGSAIIVGLGFLCTRSHCRAMRGPGQASIYGLLVAAMLLSTHSAFITSQEIVYNLILCAWLGRIPRAFTIGRASSPHDALPTSRAPTVHQLLAAERRG